MALMMKAAIEISLRVCMCNDAVSIVAKMYTKKYSRFEKNSQAAAAAACDDDDDDGDGLEANTANSFFAPYQNFYSHSFSFFKPTFPY